MGMLHTLCGSVCPRTKTLKMPVPSMHGASTTLSITKETTEKITFSLVCEKRVCNNMVP